MAKMKSAAVAGSRGAEEIAGQPTIMRLSLTKRRTQFTDAVYVRVDAMLSQGDGAVRCADKGRDAGR